MNSFKNVGQNLPHLLEKIKAKLDTINNTSIKEISVSGNTVTYTKGDGTNASFPNATTSASGLMSANDKTKLDDIGELTDSAINALCTEILGYP